MISGAGRGKPQEATGQEQQADVQHGTAQHSTAWRSTAQHSAARTRATSASAGLCWLAACSTSAAMRATAVSLAAAVVHTRSTPEPQLRVPALTVLPGPRSTGADSPAQAGCMRQAAGCWHWCGKG